MLKYLIPILIIFAFLIPFCVNAFLDGPIVPCGQRENNPNTPDIKEDKKCELCDFFRMAKNIIEFIRDLIVLIAPVFILAGGITILISTGSPDKVTLGKKIIFSAVIGVTIAFCAWLILGTLFNVLIKGQIDFSKDTIDKTGPLQNVSNQPWAWNEFRCE